MRKKRATAPCLMGCGGRIIRYSDLWSGEDTRLRRPFGTCDRCGHVQLAKLYDEKEYKVLNDRYFYRSYHPDAAGTRRETNRRKLEVTKKRLLSSRRVPRSGKMLDVGAGEGWSSEIADALGLDYYVVESQPDLAERSKKRGAVVAADSMAELEPRWTDQFSLILFRHTLEHLLEPIDALKILGACLNEHGVLYVAVPNFCQAQPKLGFRTDYIRPIHISYFTPNKLSWCLQRAGLVAISCNGESDAWAIAEKGEGRRPLIDEGEENRMRMERMVRRYRRKDFVRVSKFIFSKLVGRNLFRMAR